MRRSSNTSSMRPVVLRRRTTSRRGTSLVVTERDRLRNLSQEWRYADHVASSAAAVALINPLSDLDERETFSSTWATRR